MCTYALDYHYGCPLQFQGSHSVFSTVLLCHPTLSLFTQSDIIFFINNHNKVFPAQDSTSSYINLIEASIYEFAINKKSLATGEEGKGNITCQFWKHFYSETFLNLRS
jgi:uncharacterized protein YhfF